MPNKKLPDYTDVHPVHLPPDPEPDHKKGIVPLPPPPLPKEPPPPPPQQPPTQQPSEPPNNEKDS